MYGKHINKQEENSKDYEPLVVMKKNNHKTLVVLDAEHFVKIHKD